MTVCLSASRMFINLKKYMKSTLDLEKNSSMCHTKGTTNWEAIIIEVHILDFRQYSIFQ